MNGSVSVTSTYFKDSSSTPSGMEFPKISIDSKPSVSAGH